MTTPSDEARIDEAIIRAIRKWTADSGLSPLATFIRSEGITLTIEPEPEPVYPIRLTKSQLTTLLNGWHSINRIHTWTENERELFHVFRNATPEER